VAEPGMGMVIRKYSQSSAPFSSSLVPYIIFYPMFNSDTIGCSNSVQQKSASGAPLYFYSAHISHNLNLRLQFHSEFIPDFILHIVDKRDNILSRCISHIYNKPAVKL